MKKILLAAVMAAALPLAAHASPYNPTAGNPNSIQYSLLQSGLDLDSFDVVGAGDDSAAAADDDDDDGSRFDVDGDADTIGFAGTHWESGGFDGERYEARYQKAWRPMEGRRSRLVLDLPVSMVAVDGETATSAAVSLGVEMPVSANWTLTPRAFVAHTWAGGYFGGDGDLYGASLASRFRLAQVGRGDLVLGNLVGYTKSDDGMGETENWVFRNGAAYQFPLKGLVFGRQASARFSYTHTLLEGDPVSFEEINEISANLGVRLREANFRNRFELLRIGLLHTFADDFNATTLTVGYRF